MDTILITGGAGYIGSHTIVNLLSNGFNVISVDNFSNSYPSTYEAIEQISGKELRHYDLDICDATALENLFTEHPEIVGIIHFAAHKYVNESVDLPLKYYRNNLTSLTNLLACCEKFEVQHFVFSSSCSVYGNPEKQPVTEETPLAKAESPYAQTKLIGEQIIQDFASNQEINVAILRYFNPAGAHESGLLGENPKMGAQNIVPRITGTAMGKFDTFTIAGNDYPTRDGTCIRDYIHVCDIASAHTKALQFLSKATAKTQEIINLGSGNGTSVLELVKAFEQANDIKLNYQFGERRAGDVISIYANNTKAANILNWEPKRSIQDMMQSAWKWDKNK